MARQSHEPLGFAQSNDYSRNVKEALRYIEYFNQEHAPAFMKHFTFNLKEKFVYIGISYPKRFLKHNESNIVELNQSFACFLADMKKFVIFFQHKCYNFEKTNPDMLGVGNVNASGKVHISSSSESDPWEEFDKMTQIA